MKLFATMLILSASLFAQTPEQVIKASTTLNDDLKEKGFLVSFTAPEIPNAATYTWIWGDGMFKEVPGVSASHNFTRAMLYRVHLVVTDATKHNLYQSEIAVKVNQPVEINPAP